MRAERSIGGVVAAAFVLLSAQPAAAYCRTTAWPDATPEDGCPSQGLPLYWPSQCVGYRLYQNASGTIPVANLAPVAARAFARWTNPGEPCFPSLDVVALMPTSGQSVGYDTNGPNSNLIVFRTESWPWDPDELGHTTLTYRIDTGEVLDADMEINVADDVALDGIDLDAVLTHEAGHFLGFAHSEAPSAMEQLLAPGDAREVSADDAQGMCDVYPEGGERVTLDASGNEVRIAARTCTFEEADGACGPLDIAHGCSVTRTPLRDAGWTAAALAGLVAAGTLRRGRRVCLR